MQIAETLKQKVANYKPRESDLAQIRHAPVLFAVGITGAGKNAILHELITRWSDQYRFIVSQTTRLPRKLSTGLEQNGEHYYFVTFQEFEQMLDDKKFVEAKIIHHENIYGTSVEEIVKANQENKIAVSDLDVQGVREYIDLRLNIKPVFVLPPSYEVWIERLSKREGNESNRTIQHRLRSALKEIKYLLAEDIFHIVINDNLDHAVEQVNKIAHDETLKHAEEEHGHEVARELMTCIEKDLEKV